MNIEQIRATAEAEAPFLNDKSCINIYVGSSASDSTASDLIGIFKEAIDTRKLPAKIVRTGSFGCYDLEPIVVIEDPDSSTVLYHNVTPDDVSFLIDDCVTKNAPRSDRALCWAGSKKVNGIPHIDELQLFKLQSRIALRNCGWIDPDNINHYIARGKGYSGLSQALSMQKRGLLDKIKRFLSDNRTESGDSKAEVWTFCHDAEEANKYLICNAIEADPKALTARLLFESDPHSVLEGMLISAYAIGAPHCVILVRENADFVPRIRQALEQMNGYNLLGSNILDSEFSSGIEIREIPESGIIGYVTELFRCIGEKQPPPHVDPCYPYLGELVGKPAVTASPEIMARLSGAQIGNQEKGTASKVVTLSGSVVHKYTIEVAFEMTIRGIIDVIAGGVGEGKSLKTAKLGGPAGVFIMPNSFDLSLGLVIDRHLGSESVPGTIEVFDADSSIVDATRDIMSRIQTESCGRCLFCREGSLQILTVLEDISSNKGTPDDLDLLADLGKNMKMACLCAFGRNAPDPVLSSLDFFRDEYDERIKGSSLSVQSS